MMCAKPVVIDGQFFSCGKCLACKIKKRTAWTLRLLHHLDKNPEAVFATLTYRDDQLMIRNGVPNLVPNDLTKFFKRLRINLRRKGENDAIKYYACGEYGEDPTKTQRPHYHAIIFGYAFRGKRDLFLDETWGHGTVFNGTVTADSIRYVAQYIDKKLIGSASAFSNRENIFQVCSQGIGLEWLHSNLERVLYDSSLLFRGRKYPIPRRYREEISKMFPEAAEGVDDRIRSQAILQEADMILDLAPEFGGRSYTDLTDTEKKDLSWRIQERASAVDADLKAGLLFKQNKKGKRLNI